MQFNELLDDLEYVALVLCHVLSPVGFRPYGHRQCWYRTSRPDLVHWRDKIPGWRYSQPLELCPQPSLCLSPQSLVGTSFNAEAVRLRLCRSRY
jgi:hypothetical protein